MNLTNLGCKMRTCFFISLIIIVSSTRLPSNKILGLKKRLEYENASPTGSSLQDVRLLEDVPKYYYLMNPGDAGCPGGDELTTQTDCEAAATALGLSNKGGTWANKPRETLPGYCSYRFTGTPILELGGITGDSNVHFNDYSLPTQGRSDLIPVCAMDLTDDGFPSSGNFMIKAASTNFVLDADGDGNVDTYYCHGGNNQRWSTTSSGNLIISGTNKAIGTNPDDQNLIVEDLDSGSESWGFNNGMIESKQTQQVFDVAGGIYGTNVLVYAAHGGDNQQWDFIRSCPSFEAYGNFPKDTFFMLKNPLTNKVLSIDGQNLIVSDCNGNDNQRWKANSDGSLYISKDSQNSAIDIDVFGGCKLQMYPQHSGQNQIWEYDNGVIRNLATLQVLDVKEGVGPEVIAYAEHGADNQQWEIVDNCVQA